MIHHPGCEQTEEWRADNPALFSGRRAFSQHLAPYLPQLHSFLTNVGPRLAADDVIQVIEAIAFVLSGMPVEEAAAGLRTFTMPLIQKVHEISVKQGDVSRDELQSVAGELALSYIWAKRT